MSHQRPRSAPILIALGVLVLLVGVGTLTAMIIQSLASYPSAQAQGRVGETISASLDTDGVTILVDRIGVPVQCVVSGSDQSPVPLTADGSGNTVKYNGVTWWVLAESRVAVPPGAYSALCTSEQAGVVFALAGRSDFPALITKVGIGVGALLASILVSVLLFWAAGHRPHVNSRSGRRRRRSGADPGDFSPQSNTSFERYFDL